MINFSLFAPLLAITQNLGLSHVKDLLKQIMELVAQELSSNWDDPRYSRETADE